MYVLLNTLLRINCTFVMKLYYVYILASRRNGTLYTGVTNDLVRRTWSHQDGEVEGFTKRYGVKMLVYYEAHHDIRDAIRREKQIKAWKRQWKINLIEKENPEWKDLSSILEDFRR